MAICLPFALFHVFIASPIKLLRRTCNKNADHYYGPTCHPSCCSYNQLALTLEEEKRRPVLGYLMSMLINSLNFFFPPGASTFGNYFVALLLSTVHLILAALLGVVVLQL